MENLKLVSGFKDNEKVRISFNELAESVFGFSFEKWYQAGFWTHKYEPHAFLDGDRVIANVSVNKIDLHLGHKKIKGFQIGTVMTHPDYRNRGLSKQLMNYVLKKYDGLYDVMYLFANRTVLDFYPKFGFSKAEETQYYLEDMPHSKKDSIIRKLDFVNPDDLQLLYEMASNRQVVSSRFGSINTAELVMFYALYVFQNHFYYLEEDDVIVLFVQEEEKIEVFDVISQGHVDMNRVISQISSLEIKKVLFHFTPNIDSLFLKTKSFLGDEVLFVKTAGNFKWPNHVKHPITSQA